MCKGNEPLIGDVMGLWVMGNYCHEALEAYWWFALLKLMLRNGTVPEEMLEDASLLPTFHT